MDPEQNQVNIGRYMRFVIVFLIIIFGTLALYQHFYGDEARRAQESQLKLEAEAQAGAGDTAATAAE